MVRTFLISGLMIVAGSAALTATADEQPYHVMVANDDGVDSAGIEALVTELAADPSYRVTVVAPAEQQSAMGHSLIIRDEVAVRRFGDIAGCTAWAVDGTPATAARVGLGSLLVDDPPDLVLSGINKGENSGRIAWYSGTVGAAREAALAGYPSMAMSLQRDWANGGESDFVTAARWAKPLIDEIRASGLPKGTYLNVNFPVDTAGIKGYRLTRMGQAIDQLNSYEMVREEDGVRYFRSRWFPPESDTEGSDVQAMYDGFVTVTPLTLDNTDFDAFPSLTGFALCAPPETELPLAAGE